MRKGGLVLLALVAALLVGSGCGDSSEGSGDSAHINDESGSTNGLLPDERAGTPPKPAKVTDLRKAADEANCYLLIGTAPRQGKEVAPGTAPPEYQTEPP